MYNKSIEGRADSMGTEAMIRISCFFGVLVTMFLAELIIPKRKQSNSKPVRWANNLGLVVLNTLAVRFLMPTTAVGIAVLAEQQQWGLFHYVQWNTWVEIADAVIFLDAIIYLQHVMFHAIPIFWRLHMVHHADPEIDVTTGLRFHTIEILISMGIKFIAIIFLGAASTAVITFEILLNGTAMFNHSNIHLPKWLDKILRIFTVTPDMHRVHHSVIVNETNSNFGFNLPWWDYIFGTYRAQPSKGHQDMTIGLTQFQDNKILSIFKILMAPFKEKPGGYDIHKS